MDRQPASEYTEWSKVGTYNRLRSNGKSPPPPNSGSMSVYTCGDWVRLEIQVVEQPAVDVCVEVALSGRAGPAEGGTLGAIGRHMNHRMQRAVERPMDAACLLPGAQCALPYLPRPALAIGQRRVSRL
jgi:hypothetical protein